MEQQNVQKALSIISQIEPLLESAERSLKSARTWGFIDLVGGGLFTDIMKHSKIGKAKSSMERAQVLFEQLASTLSSIQFTDDMKMQTGGFTTFADFIFDGAIFDAIMLSKIFSSIDRVREFQRKMSDLRSFLLKLN